MVDRYKRKQILLKREDGTPAGFLRLERVGDRCNVEVQVDGPVMELHAVLLGGEKPFPLGKISRGRTIHAPNVEDMNTYKQAAVLSGERLLFVGGEDVDFRKVRKALATPPPRRVTAREQREHVPDTVAGQAKASAQQSYDAVRQTATDAHDPESSDEEGSYTTDKIGTQTMDEANTQATHTIKNVHKLTPAEGWVFTPYKRDLWDCYTGQYIEDGQITARMHAVAGVYALEPPPGLTGFVWDAGYWVQVVGIRDL